MKIKVYTTRYWFKKDLPFIIECVSKSGVTPEIEVKKISLPKVPTEIDHDGAVRPDWTWLKANVFEPGLHSCLHITTKERNRLGLTHPNPKSRLGGSYNVDNDNVLDFLVIADKGRKAPGYSFDQFTRIFFHELAHGFDHWSFGIPNINVHHFDYDLKQIHNIFALYDFNQMSLRQLLKVALREWVKRLRDKM